MGASPRHPPDRYQAYGVDERQTLLRYGSTLELVQPEIHGSGDTAAAEKSWGHHCRHGIGASFGLVWLAHVVVTESISRRWSHRPLGLDQTHQNPGVAADPFSCWREVGDVLLHLWQLAPWFEAE